MKPRIIKTEEQYELALEEAEQLIALDPAEDSPDGDALELFATLIDNYEREQFPIAKPDPIEAIRFRMEEAGLENRDLIPFIGSRSKVSEVLSKKRALSLNMIRALSEGLQIPIDVLARDPKPDGEQGMAINWSDFPVREMAKRGWITAKTSEIKRNTENLARSFFSDVTEGQMQTLFRRKCHERSGRKLDQYALHAWMARLIKRSRQIEVAEKFDKSKLTDGFFEELRRITRTEQGPTEIIEHLKSYGIVVLVEPHLPKTKLDGAVFYTSSGVPIIGITVRYDRLDNFWFTLFHELAHLKLHFNLMTDVFIDDMDVRPVNDNIERAADRFAGDTLLPREYWERTEAYGEKTSDSVKRTAEQLGVHHSVVAGRIRYDENNYKILTDLVGSGEVRKHFSEVNWS